MAFSNVTLLADIRMMSLALGTRYVSVCLFNSIFVPAGPVVNDGGLSWLRKSYQRMKEQAEREQRSLNDVVAERYGVRTEGALAAFTPSHAQCGYEKSD